MLANLSQLEPVVEELHSTIHFRFWNQHAQGVVAIAGLQDRHLSVRQGGQNIKEQACLLHVFMAYQRDHCAALGQ